jgi:hypothetical protein
MYAYSIAAAHLELPHVSLDNYMTSNARAGGEAWPFIDEIDFKDVCAQDLSTTDRKLPVSDGIMRFTQSSRWTMSP